MSSALPLTSVLTASHAASAVETIACEGQMLALIVRAHFCEAGIHFFTPNDSSQQLGFMKHPAGKVIGPAHVRIE
jgi:hypothetical protein